MPRSSSLRAIEAGNTPRLSTCITWVKMEFKLSADRLTDLKRTLSQNASTWRCCPKFDLNLLNLVCRWIYGGKQPSTRACKSTVSLSNHWISISRFEFLKNWPLHIFTHLTLIVWSHLAVYASHQTRSVPQRWLLWLGDSCLLAWNPTRGRPVSGTRHRLEFWSLETWLTVNQFFLPFIQLILRR